MARCERARAREETLNPISLSRRRRCARPTPMAISLCVSVYLSICVCVHRAVKSNPRDVGVAATRSRVKLKPHYRSLARAHRQGIPSAPPPLARGVKRTVKRRSRDTGGGSIVRAVGGAGCFDNVFMMIESRRYWRRFTRFGNIDL